MKPIIRSATGDDLPLCADLLHALFSQDLEFQPDRNLQLRGLTQILKEPATGTILVAEVEGRVVGMVSLLFSVSTVLGGRVATLEDMIVEESQRKKGIGRTLFDQAMNHAQSVGCLRVTLLTDHNNDTAIRFYEGFGFHRSPMVPLRRVF